MTMIHGLKITTKRDENFSEHAIKLLQDFYMQPDEKSPQEAYARASVAWSGGDNTLAQRIYDASSRNWFVFASPLLSNAPSPGTVGKGMPISCFLSYVGDNLHSLIDHTTEERWLSVKGGGVGGHWSDVRSASDVAPGPIPFIHTIDADMIAYRQGKTRKGSYAAYLSVSHPDILEFLHIRVPTGDTNRKSLNIHHAVNITDAFIQAVKENADWKLIDTHTKEVRDVVRARDLWQQILEIRYRTGEPYLNFIDTANAALPQTQKDLGLKINGSNLCVAPETRILTIDGYTRIDSLEGKEVFVWNGETFSNTIINKTSEGAELLQIEFDNGSMLNCTPEHKFYTQADYGTPIIVTEAKKLKAGDKLKKPNFAPVWSPKEPYVLNKHWYTQGFFSGDGCTYNGRNHIDLYGAKIALKKYMEYTKEQTFSAKQDRQRIVISPEFVKFHIPFHETRENKLSWLAGLFDSDGSVARNGTNEALQLTSIHHDFLVDLMLFLQEMGVNSKVTNMVEKGLRKLPNGRGELKNYMCQKAWRILISSSGLHDLLTLGGFFKRLKVTLRKPQRNAEQFIRVANVTNTGRRDKTYCCNEQIHHTIYLEGIPTGNCNEIHLPTNEDRTAVCCLSSLNLEYYDEWKSTNLIADLVCMLDNVLQYFIEQAPSELTKAVYSAHQERSLGLGAMGFHSLLQRRGIAFESEKAREINQAIFSEIKEKAVKESRRLGHERGEAPDMLGTGLRNSHLLAIAPNANSSIIADTSPSIEPWHGNAFVHRTRAGSFLSKNRYLIDALGKHNTDEVWSSIIANNGSVKHLDFISDEVKSVFKTAPEIDQMWIIKHAAERQKYICQGQSVNLFFGSGSDRAYVNRVHLEAHRLGLKGLYYLRTESSSKAENIGNKVERNALIDAETCSIDNKDECAVCSV